MKQTSKTVLFFGNERIATGVSTTTPTLLALIEAGYTVAAVVSNYTAGESRKARPLEIQAIAEQHGIPVLLPSKLGDMADQLKEYAAAIGVLVAYGQMVPQSVLDIFPYGIVNIHPSLLPLHRGSTPIESSILAGETRTGVSLMKLVKEMDAGPVYAQSEVALEGNELKQALADELLNIGSQALVSLLPGIMDGSVIAKPQEASQATYDHLISKSDGIIDWTKPALQIEREIRAYAQWPGSRTMFGDKEVIITKASSIEGNGTPGEPTASKDSLAVACGTGMLVIEEIKPAGKQAMPISAFLSGYRRLFE